MSNVVLAPKIFGSVLLTIQFFLGFYVLEFNEYPVVFFCLFWIFVKLIQEGVIGRSCLRRLEVRRRIWSNNDVKEEYFAAKF